MVNHNSIQCLMFILLHIEVIGITIYFLPVAESLPVLISGTSFCLFL